MLNAMRNLLAAGINDPEAVISTAADVIGGGDIALRIARRVYDAHFRIFMGG